MQKGEDMIYWDTHMHTHFSGDCEISPEEMIASAKNKKLKGICLTDHLDYDYKEEPGLFDLDVTSYEMKIKQLQAVCPNNFEIRFGIEIGLQPHIVHINNEVTRTHDFDFVIGSSHVVHGMDPYYANFYEGKTEKEAYLEYFSSILENLETDADFDVYGHIDYVVRYGPNRNQFYSYKEYADIIDTILTKLIEKGKGIEINTGGFKYGLGHPNPTEEIIKRYCELGGEIITVGADAHKPEHIAFDFQKVPAILKDAGFKYYTVFKERKPVFLPLK